MMHNLLVVDDCGQNLKVLKVLFDNEDFDVFFAKSAESALRILEQTKIDLALLDVMMPDVNGIQLCSIMKQDPSMRQIPVIFLSADCSIESKLSGFEMGCVDYISKPFVSSEVIARVNLHLSLVDAQKKLQSDSEFKMNMLSMASHELSNELTRIALCIDMCRKSFEKKDDAKHERQLEKLKYNTKVMSGTLRELIGMARNNIGELTPTLTLFNLQEFADELIRENYDPEFPTRIKPDIKIEHDMIISDKSFLSHIMNNLVSNGMKYSSKETPLEIHLSCSSKTLTFSVKDYGIGIPEEEQQAVFSNFSRASNVGNIKGTGIGLSLVKQFVETLEGEITLTSSTGGPTTFSISIPIHIREIKGTE